MRKWKGVSKTSKYINDDIENQTKSLSSFLLDKKIKVRNEPVYPLTVFPNIYLDIAKSQFVTVFEKDMEFCGYYLQLLYS